MLFEKNKTMTGLAHLKRKQITSANVIRTQVEFVLTGPALCQKTLVCHMFYVIRFALGCLSMFVPTLAMAKVKTVKTELMEIITKNGGHSGS